MGTKTVLQLARGEALAMIASNPPILIVFALAFAAYANRRPLTRPRSSFLPAELAAVHAATGDGMQRFAKLSTCFRFPVISRLSCFASIRMAGAAE